MKFAALGQIFLGSALCVAFVFFAPTSVQGQGACSTTNDVFENPFNRQSAHHLPIGTGARYASDNDPATRDWLRANSFAINVGGPWGVDVAAVTAGDPMVQITSRVIGPDAGYGLPVTIRVPRNGFETRVGTNQSGNTDGVAVIYDRVNGQTHQLRQYNWNNGRPTAAQYRTWDIRGLGHGTRSGERVGTSASGVAALFGVLRGREINTPGHRIEHALQIALPGFRENECNVMLGMGIILPATSRDNAASRSGNNTGSIRYGELLALPPNVNLNSLGLSEPGMRLAQAIRDYGLRVVDNGGCGAGAIRADQHVSSQVMNQLRNDIPRIYPHIRVVTNGEWRPGLTAIGGGTPRAPNCAFDAGASQRQVSTPSSQPATSTPQNGQSGSTPANQNQQASTGSTSSAGGTLSWAAVPGANNYYVEVRDTTSRREKVYGRMAPPQSSGCANGGTCEHVLPPLPAGRSYQWTFRAVVGGQPQPFSPWQPLDQSSASVPAGNQGSSTVASTPQSQPSTSSSDSGGAARLSWAAVPRANNYYVEVRDTTSRREKVHGRMAPPRASGCAGGGTCEHVVPPLPAGRNYQWNWRPVVDGKPKPFRGWRPLR